MKKLRALALRVVVAHWTIAIVHLFIAARILPSPNSVSSLAIVLITLGHVCVFGALWKVSDRPAGWAALIFFLCALGADVYEHFLHASANNVFAVTGSNWAVWFDISVIGLLWLEIVACSLAILLISRRQTMRAAT